MTKIPYNFHTVALRSIANDLAVADPRWARTVQLLRDAADELEAWQEHGDYFHKDRRYDPNFGDDKLCKCGHKYYRHFDTFEDMRPVGCKYCMCENGFELAEETNNDGT